MSEYQRYQLLWMLRHDHPLQELIQELEELRTYDPEDTDQLSMPLPELFDQWEQDCGFGFEIWACEDEWADSGHC